jgi:hypothetical protein
VSSFAAHPPLTPEPMTIASNMSAIFENPLQDSVMRGAG